MSPSPHEPNALIKVPLLLYFTTRHLKYSSAYILPELSTATSIGYSKLLAELEFKAQFILPELSSIIIIFAGISLVPVPGGGDLEFTFFVKTKKKIRSKILVIFSIALFLKNILKFY